MKACRLSVLTCAFATTIATVSMAQDTIWGIDNGRNVLGTFTSDNPGVFTDIGPTGITTGFTNSLEFDSFGNLWASDGTTLYSINTDTGTGTWIGSHGNLNGETITDFTWDGSQMWAIGTICGTQSSLWTIDLATGTATFVCKTDTFGPCDVGLTVAGDGTFFGHDLVSDIIYTIDPNTCSTQIRIELPFDSNFGQGLTSSGDTNYHVAFNNIVFEGELYEFDGSGTYNFLGTLGPLQIAGADVEQEPAKKFEIQLLGDCPGRMTVDITGATPFGRVAVAYGLRFGSTSVPPCPGLRLNIASARLLEVVTADGNGHAQLGGYVPANLCGQVIAQAVDLPTCEASGTATHKAVIEPFNNPPPNQKYCSYSFVDGGIEYYRGNPFPNITENSIICIKCPDDFECKPGFNKTKKFCVGIRNRRDEFIEVGTWILKQRNPDGCVKCDARGFTFKPKAP